uniref:Arrestin C-terminal-like domain-containing protein n=1 Tax=Trichobilharzia regenti TaxID=157069 RepID=A0AA85J8B0_TRIRE
FAFSLIKNIYLFFFFEIYFLASKKYYHGESIEINVLVDNNSNKTVKKIKLSVIQITDITLFSHAVYRCTVDESEYE